ncbi:helix-turn-helix domain-containing protein [Thermodesulfatator atlanticus]
MQIGKKIKYVRKHYKLSQEEFAAYFGISQRSLSALEIGERRIDFNVLNTLVQKFQVNPMWLFFDEEEPFVENAECLER